VAAWIRSSSWTRTACRADAELRDLALHEVGKHPFLIEQLPNVPDWTTLPANITMILSAFTIY
jgi:hypothetical protein